MLKYEKDMNCRSSVFQNPELQVMATYKSGLCLNFEHMKSYVLVLIISVKHHPTCNPRACFDFLHMRSYAFLVIILVQHRLIWTKTV